MSSYGTFDKTQVARDAYGKRDASLSKMAHEQRAVEGHRTDGDYIKSIVYGGFDGVLTSFALISGAVGGGLGIREILIIGLSSLGANAFSMGVGDTVSTFAYNDHVLHERKRECWEFDNFVEGEIQEMIDLYELRGLPRDEATEVVKTMAKYRDFFIDVMMAEELKLTVPDEDDNPYKEGFITFLSFMFFGSLPLMPYIFIRYFIPDVQPGTLFPVACLATMAVLFLLGTFKSTFSTKHWAMSGLEFLLVGSVAASTSYGIGLIIQSLAKEWFELHGSS